MVLSGYQFQGVFVVHKFDNSVPSLAGYDASQAPKITRRYVKSTYMDSAQHCMFKSPLEFPKLPEGLHSARRVLAFEATDKFGVLYCS